MKKLVYESPSIQKMNTGLMNKFGTRSEYEPVKQIDGVSVHTMMAQYGSPLFVLSERTIRNNYQHAVRAFSTRYPKVQFAWSYKTNYLNSVCRIFHQEGSWAEVVSGDNGTASYNEPFDMFDALVDKGVNPDDIVLDYAGFRTFDSMVRANKVFGLNNFIVVSQDWHCERAIYIGQSQNISMIGFAAKDPNISTKAQLREYPARVSAFIDCYVVKNQPKYLGEKVEVIAIK